MRASRSHNLPRLGGRVVLVALALGILGTALTGCRVEEDEHGTPRSSRATQVDPEAYTSDPMDEIRK